jgi:hypothetical protein
MLYASYARVCLKTVRLLSDRDDRVVHREMAAEWLILADQALMLAGQGDEQRDTSAPRHIRSVG